MIFLTLRNNRKLSHSWIENFRKSFFGSIIVTAIMLMILALDIKPHLLGTVAGPYDILHMPALFLPMASMPLTMFTILSLNKHGYIKLRFKFMFEGLFMAASIAIATVFYLRLISILMLQIAFIASSFVIIFSSFFFGLSHIRYRATTMYGKIMVEPISFDTPVKYFLTVLFISLGFLFQGGDIIFFKFVPEGTDNYLIYQLLIQVASITFFLLHISIFTASRSLGQSQEVLYYRFAQLMIITTIFLVIALGVYRAFVDVTATRDLIDDIFIGINILPAILLFSDLWLNKRRTAKYKNYQGFTEMRLLIKIFSAVIAVLVNMIIATEIKYFVYGESQSNMDSTIIGLSIILLMIIVPFFLFWKKITKRSSRILTVLVFLVFAFALYKFYFFANAYNTAIELWLPIDSMYTMVTLAAVIVVQIITIVLQARSSHRAFTRYGHVNTDKEANNG